MPITTNDNVVTRMGLFKFSDGGLYAYNPSIAYKNVSADTAAKSVLLVGTVKDMEYYFYDTEPLSPDEVIATRRRPGSSRVQYDHIITKHYGNFESRKYDDIFYLNRDGSHLLITHTELITYLREPMEYYPLIDRYIYPIVAMYSNKDNQKYTFTVNDLYILPRDYDR